MTNKEVEAIVGGYHGDPFRILGIHAVTDQAGAETWEIRAFLPQADSVEVVANGIASPMKRMHTQGVFAAALKEYPGPYRLRLKLPNLRWGHGLDFAFETISPLTGTGIQSGTQMQQTGHYPFSINFCLDQQFFYQ